LFQYLLTGTWGYRDIGIVLITQDSITMEFHCGLLISRTGVR